MERIPFGDLSFSKQALNLPHRLSESRDAAAFEILWSQIKFPWMSLPGWRARQFRVIANLANHCAVFRWKRNPEAASPHAAAANLLNALAAGAVGSLERPEGWPRNRRTSFHPAMPPVLTFCLHASMPEETIGRACLSVDTQKLPPGLLDRTSHPGRKLERWNVGTRGCPRIAPAAARCGSNCGKKGAD